MERDTSKITADMEVVIEYNRLRSSFWPNLPLLRIIKIPTTNMNDDFMKIGSIGDVSPKRKKSKTSVEHAIIGKGKKRKATIEDSFQIRRNAKQQCL